MRVAFLNLPVPGHLNPMTALARKYQARGLAVVFLSLPDVAPFVQACSAAVYRLFGGCVSLRSKPL
jgi:UDP:flavonoid glycosyltransferase YjiC (YdhE family)